MKLSWKLTHLFKLIYILTDKTGKTGSNELEWYLSLLVLVSLWRKFYEYSIFLNDHKMKHAVAKLRLIWLDFASQKVLFFTSLSLELLTTFMWFLQGRRQKWYLLNRNIWWIILYLCTSREIESNSQEAGLPVNTLNVN